MSFALRLFLYKHVVVVIPLTMQSSSVHTGNPIQHTKHEKAVKFKLN